jgi:hypothetical protein
MTDTSDMVAPLPSKRAARRRPVPPVEREGMKRTIESLVIGCLVAAATFCGLMARGAEPVTVEPTEDYSVVAQSGPQTAGTGRQPIAERIAASRLPRRDEPSARQQPTARIEQPATVAEKPEPAAAPTPSAEKTLTAKSSPTQAAPPAPQAVPAAARPSVSHDEERLADAEPATTRRQALLLRVRNSIAAITGGPRPAPAEASAVDPEPTAEELAELTQAQAVAPPLSDIDPTDSLARRQPRQAAEAGESLEDDLGEPRAATDERFTTLPTPPTPRLTLTVVESHVEAEAGRPIEWQLRLCNTGGTAARNVEATLFFAEGIEPVAAAGATAALAAGEVRFDPVPSLPAGGVVELSVTAVGTEAGPVVYRAEVESRDLPGPVAREGVIRVADAADQPRAAR